MLAATPVWCGLGYVENHRNMKDVGVDDGSIGSPDPGSDARSDVSDGAEEPFAFGADI